MLVAKISEEKANELRGREFQSGALFGPELDNNNNWIISLVEAQFLNLGDFEVVEFEPLQE